ncbi:HTH domain protein [Halalkaliarchaeum desulfuricum]|uniref:HTH domain protein n=1 Tax=Halalkaliarchaeum desulfuricum TaxID=2055893 RepID=A0A343TN32_9EURY|nr:helix-turn-helix transcriptional regulator [Halalkaliarchaeum desulfuricum]AUX10504.1 HTH domain protein [Halalkaliarchaeum desulfuricum]
MTDGRPTSDFDDVCGIVANETRFSILQALWDAHTETPAEIEGPERDPVPFSELRERVGVQDSGRFNYHLSELVPRFVQHREDGYALTHTGARIVGAAVSGVYTETDTELDPTAVGDCGVPDCDGTLEASYEDGHVTVACDGCDVRIVMHAPPILIGAHDIESNPDTLQQYTLSEIQKTIRGFCPLCNGPIDTRVARAHLDGEAPEDDRVKITHQCRECGQVSHTSAVSLLLDHPAVVSLLYEAGYDYRDVALWRRPDSVESAEFIVDDDPVQVEVTVTVDDEPLRFLLDGELQVIEYERP